MKDHPFKPAWWLRNSHLQTIWPLLFRPSLKNTPLINERLELADGDFIDLSWLGTGKTPIVLILHGFEGSIESHYAKGMLQAVYNQGWRGVFMHFRGCSSVPNRLRRGYHSGETSDLATVIDILQAREPNVPIAAIGFSLGGNVLLKWLGETKKQNPLVAAVAISVPFELHKTAKRIHEGFSQIYEKYLLKCLYARLSLKYQSQCVSNNSSLPLPVSSLEEFDEKVTAPLYGFKGAQDYYAQSSSRQYLSTIAVPTLLLHAKDDPFMTADVIPALDELSPQVELETTEIGGHVGFVAGRYPWRAEYWLEQRVPIFLQKYL